MTYHLPTLQKLDIDAFRRQHKDLKVATASDDIVLAVMHKLRMKAVGITDRERANSKRWLSLHGVLE